MIPTAGGSQPGGYAEGAIPTGYVPQQIGYDAAGNTQLTSSTQGSGGGSGINPANTIVPGTNITQGQLDAYEELIAPGGNYDATTDILTPEQQAYVSNSPEAQAAQEGLSIRSQYCKAVTTSDTTTLLICSMVVDLVVLVIASKVELELLVFWGDI